jgi:murein L,D-transpeptidase YcbB/YkuD
LETPVELVEYVLRGDPRWTRKAILAAMEKGVEQTVRLPEPVPVHVLYWTAWVDESGTLQLRSDIYSRDSQLDAAFHTAPPAS